MEMCRYAGDLNTSRCKESTKKGQGEAHHLNNFQSPSLPDAAYLAHAFLFSNFFSALMVFFLTDASTRSDSLQKGDLSDPVCVALHTGQ